MGSCGTKLQKEHCRSNVLPAEQHHTPVIQNSIRSDLTQSYTGEIPATICIVDIKKRKRSVDSIISSSFEQRDIIDDDDGIQTKCSNSNMDNVNKTINGQSIENERLINLTFNRTLFCEDITYEYALSCSLTNDIINIEEEIIPQWILRLTVEKLTKFYTETLEKYPTNTTKTIPHQFGKVMKPKVFTLLLNNILSQPSILKDKNTFFSETTSNFLNIPYDIRPIIQYNPDKYVYNNNLDCEEEFKYYDIIMENEEKYKYLCHNIEVYKHDYEYDDCCQCYDEPQITCYSYWVRSLKDKIDFLFTITSNNIFYIIMSDLSYNISQILINDFGFDSNSAWIITDYLPKDLLFNHVDDKCNGQIIYKYDPRTNDYDDGDDDHDDAYGIFLLEVIGNKLLERHNIDIDELHNMCHTLRVQHTSLPPSLPEMSPSLSEYIVSAETQNILSHPHSDQNMDINMSESNIDFNEESILSSTSQSEQDYDDEKFRIFFSAFIDEEGEDDINVCQWLQSLQKIGLNLSEKEIVSTFNFMIKQNEDSEGYIDFVDFTKFCNENVDCTLKEVKRTQELLNNFIKRN